MAEIDPHRAEDVGHLGLEDRRVGIDQPMDAILLHQLVPVVQVGRALDPGRLDGLSFSNMASVLHGRRPAFGSHRPMIASDQKKSKYSFCSHSVGSSPGGMPASSSHRWNRPASLRLSLRK